MPGANRWPQTQSCQLRMKLSGEIKSLEALNLNAGGYSSSSEEPGATSAEWPRTMKLDGWPRFGWKVTRAGFFSQVGAAQSESGSSPWEAAPISCRRTAFLRPTSQLHDNGIELFPVIGHATVGGVVAKPACLGIERVKKGQIELGNAGSGAVDHKPAATLPHPSRQFSLVGRQAVVNPEGAPDDKDTVGHDVGSPVVNSFRRPSTRGHVRSSRPCDLRRAR